MFDLIWDTPSPRRIFCFGWVGHRISNPPLFISTSAGQESIFCFDLGDNWERIPCLGYTMGIFMSIGVPFTLDFVWRASRMVVRDLLDFLSLLKWPLPFSVAFRHQEPSVFAACDQAPLLLRSLVQENYFRSSSVCTTVSAGKDL